MSIRERVRARYEKEVDWFEDWAGTDYRSTHMRYWVASLFFFVFGAASGVLFDGSAPRIFLVWFGFVVADTFFNRVFA